MRLVSYCGNVHPTPDLASLWAALDIARDCRGTLGWDRLGYGLWVAPSTLPALERDPGELRARLETAGLVSVTANAFPCGDFHAPVVKRAVYHPDWSRHQRLEYTLAVARVLTAIAPAGRQWLTVSTLPIGHRMEGDESVVFGAARNLCTLVTELERLRERTGVGVRVAIEPEPGCWLETAAEAAEFFSGPLSAAADAVGISGDRIRQHLGLCFDTCHHAVVFEEPQAALQSLSAVGVSIFKAQLSSAIEVPDPSSRAARAALSAFDEPRFLHQVRARTPEGVVGADDLPQAWSLPATGPWRVHFHVPVHRAAFPPLGTTRTVLEEALGALLREPTSAELEVETYTWSVLPEDERPDNLATGLASELAWVASIIGEIIEAPAPSRHP